MHLILAQQRGLDFGSWGIAQFAIALIIVVAIVAIVMIFLRQAGIPVPGWIWNVVWIVVGAVVCIAAIRFIMGM